MPKRRDTYGENARAAGWRSGYELRKYVRRHRGELPADNQVRIPNAPTLHQRGYNVAQAAAEHRKRYYGKSASGRKVTRTAKINATKRWLVDITRTMTPDEWERYLDQLKARFGV